MLELFYGVVIKFFFARHRLFCFVVQASVGSAVLQFRQSSNNFVAVLIQFIEKTASGDKNPQSKPYFLFFLFLQNDRREVALSTTAFNLNDLGRGIEN